MSRVKVILPAALLLLAACGQSGNAPSGPALPALVVETTDEKADALKRAFGTSAASQVVSGAAVAEVDALFQTITEAGSIKNIQGVLDHIDFDYLLARAESEGMDVSRDREKRAALVKGMRQGARKSWFSPGNEMFGWKRSRVMRIEPTGDSKFLLAYVRHDVDDEGGNLKARWWLVRDGQAWKIFDWEFLNTGIRISRLMGAFSDSTNLPPWVSKVPLIISARIKLDNGDPEGALAELKRLADSNLPSDFEAVRLQLRATAHYQLENYEAALRGFESVLQLKPDFPDARFMRGSSLFRLDRYEQAIPELKWYVETLGSDGPAMLELAHCLTWLDRYDEAIEYYRASLRDTPLLEALHYVGLYLPDDQVGEIGEWFKQLGNHDDNFIYLSNEWYEVAYHPAAMKELCKAFREIRPNSPMLAYYTARLLLDEEEPAEAAAALFPALKNVNGETLVDYRQWYWEAMCRAGQGLQALAETKEPAVRKEAFVYVADDYLNNRDSAGLNAVCEAYKEEGKAAPALHFYLGEADFFAKDYAAAEQHFREGLALVSKDQDYYAAIRSGLWDSMRKQGRALEAYAEFEPAGEVFAYLAELLFTDEQAEELEKLIVAHKEANKDDPWLHRAAGDLAWLRKDWAQAVAGYRQYISPVRQEDTQYWDVVERSVRSGLRANDLGFAEKMAREAFEERNLWLLIIALACGDKPAATIAAIDEFIAEDTPQEAAEWMNEFYADEDCGPKLRSENYASLHKRFPPPAEE